MTEAEEKPWYASYIETRRESASSFHNQTCQLLHTLLVTIPSAPTRGNCINTLFGRADCLSLNQLLLSARLPRICCCRRSGLCRFSVEADEHIHRIDAAFRISNLDEKPEGNACPNDLPQGPAGRANQPMRPRTAFQEIDARRRLIVMLGFER